MENELQIGDFISVDGVEHYVRYPLPNDKFINESGEMVVYDSYVMIEKNVKSKPLESFDDIEKKMLMFFNNGRHKSELTDDIIDVDNITFDFTFKKLLSDKFLMRLFPKKEKYVSKIENESVLKLL